MDEHDIFKDVTLNQAQHLEMYAAAFLKEVGSDRASEYILVQKICHNPLNVSWSFEKKSEFSHD